MQGLELQGVSGSVGTHCPRQVTQIAKVQGGAGREVRKDTATVTAPTATVAALVAVGVRALPSLGIRPSIEIPIDLYRDASSETGTWQPLIAARRRGGGR